MSLRSKFNQLFNRSNQKGSAPSSSATYDDLSEVPFAGGQSTSEAELAQDSSEHLDRVDTQKLGQTALLAFVLESAERAPKNPDDYYASLPDDTPLPPDFAEQISDSPEAQAFRNFFKADLRIKKDLINLAPTSADRSSEDGRMQYVENAYRAFRDFQHDFRKIDRDFYGESPSPILDEFFAQGQEQFMLGDYGPDVPGKIYRNVFTDIRPDFVEEVKESCVGYTLFNQGLSITRGAKTINELLHAYHSAIMNNESLLQKVPAIAEKPLLSQCNVTLRGDTTAAAQQIFNEFPTDMPAVGYTDIVAVGDYTAMMVRDRGHALVISTEPDEQDHDKLRVNYNVPKICNYQKIKALPGLSGYSKNGARGGFSVPKSKIGHAIADFIGRVPTDDDLFTPGGLAYREN